VDFAQRRRHGRVRLWEHVAASANRVSARAGDEALACPDSRRFLIGTSTLPRAVRGLCDHGVGDSATSLRRIEKSNLFLIALNHRRT
jgi:ATP/maltotriose-dependent transcriptional regulator MalT